MYSFLQKITCALLSTHSQTWHSKHIHTHSEISTTLHICWPYCTLQFITPGVLKHYHTLTCWSSSIVLVSNTQPFTDRGYNHKCPTGPRGRKCSHVVVGLIVAWSGDEMMSVYSFYTKYESLLFTESQLLCDNYVYRQLQYSLWMWSFTGCMKLEGVGGGINYCRKTYVCAYHICAWFQPYKSMTNSRIKEYYVHTPSM